MPARKKLGELLKNKGLVDDIQLLSAMSHQRNWGGKIGSALVELGFVSPAEIAQVLEEQLRQKCLQESQMIPEPEALALMSVQDATKYVALPLRVRGNEVLIALSNPFDLAITDEIGFKLGKRVRGALAVESVIKKSIKKFYGGSGGRDYKVEIRPEEEKQVELMHFDKGSPHTAMDVLDTPFDAGYQDGLKVEPKVKEGAAQAQSQLKEDQMAKALAYLLIEKGIITKEELQIRLNYLKNSAS